MYNHAYARCKAVLGNIYIRTLSQIYDDSNKDRFKRLSAWIKKTFTDKTFTSNFLLEDSFSAIQISIRADVEK